MERIGFKMNQIKWKHLRKNKDRQNSHKCKRCFVVKLILLFFPEESAYEIDLLHVIPRLALQCKLRARVFWDVMLHCCVSGSPCFKGTY
jgi:hypothetical protein